MGEQTKQNKTTTREMTYVPFTPRALQRANTEVYKQRLGGCKMLAVQAQGTESQSPGLM